MPSITSDFPTVGRAEHLFREAFERLKLGRPVNVQKGSKVSQATVAREAGVDPSALRKSRFPELIDEIQCWVESQPVETRSPRQQILAARQRRRTLYERIEALEAQRDDALSKLLLAEARIVELVQENQRLRAQSGASKLAPVRSLVSGMDLKKKRRFTLASD